MSPVEEKLVLTVQERRLLDALATGRALKESGPEIGVTEGTGKLYLMHARTRNRCRTSSQLLYLYGQELAWDRFVDFFSRRVAA